MSFRLPIILILTALFSGMSAIEAKAEDAVSAASGALSRTGEAATMPPIMGGAEMMVPQEIARNRPLTQ